MSIVLEQLTKSFDSHAVVDHVSLEVAEGELFVLLGASGSGKSTVLRLIAGLAQPDFGRIVLQGRDVGDLPPQRRGTGFVFQNYSIFRHMRVSENIEFGLKIRRVAATDRARRREELLELVGMAGMGGRYAHELSGGQQQRVALARALAHEPSVLLLDEPFGALDVKIRAQLRRSLKEIQERLGVTTILVTHDQEEAFEVADRVGVIDQGHLLEVGTAQELYARPRTLFVATFLGAGTVLVGRARGGMAQFGPLHIPIPPETPHEDFARVHLLLRPEDVTLGAEAPPAGTLSLGRGKIVGQSFTGPLVRVRLRLPPLAGTRQITPPLPPGEEGVLLDAMLPAGTPLPETELFASLRRWRILEQPALHLLLYDAPESSESALALGRQLVEALDAKATVLGVASDPESAEMLRDDLRYRQLEQGLEKAELVVRQGNPQEEIWNRQAETPYDLIVLPAGGPFDPSAHGASVAGFLRRSDVPILIAASPRRNLKRVLICTAAGESGHNGVLVGGRLAAALGAAVTVLYVTRASGSPGAPETAHLERAAGLLRDMQVEHTVRVRSAGTAAEGILAEAHEADHDLMVIGGHGSRTPDGFDPSDVTLQVLLQADRPLLIVPLHELA